MASKLTDHLRTIKELIERAREYETGVIQGSNCWRRFFYGVPIALSDFSLPGIAGWLLGGAIVGSGALAMYNRPVVGAILGFVIQLITLAWLISHAQHFI
jgi:hypothetical protein